MIDYSLYLVTDDPSRYEGNWLDGVVAAVEGGVTCVQYRDTESSSDVRYARVRQLQDALGGRIPLVINNEPELAASVQAEGVHVGQSDLPPKAVRTIVGPACEIGLSITDISQLSALGEETPVDCLGIGPVFDARKTKADASDALGVEGLSVIIAAVRDSGFTTSDSKTSLAADRRGLPTVAIGGITLANAADVLATGVGGLAVVSAFSKSPDPFLTARSFRKLFP